MELLNESTRPCEFACEVGDMVGTRFTRTAAELDALPRIKRWKTAWESRDPDRIIALYVSDCRHRSPRAVTFMPDKVASGLVTLDDVRMYAFRAAQNYHLYRSRFLH